MSKYIKNTEKPVQKYRFIVQILFSLLCVWIGVEFYFFVEYLESGVASEYFSRPPGVEGFLPISALMSIYYFVQTGEIHDAHPAGFFILMAVILVSLVFGKSFCSWLCPIGTLSEMIADFGDKIQKKLFKKIYRLPRWLDYILRSLKYLLLGFFVYSIFFVMTTTALKMFLDSPYNLIADVKMYYFFADISRLALIVIASLFVLSIFIRNFWCRYLCPYGALLGIASLLSPQKIKRDASSCIDCALCAKACPSQIKVDKISTVFSDECSTCMSCVDACPVADTLELKSYVTKRKVSKKIVAAAIVFIFTITTGIGMLTNNWNNNISEKEYLNLFQNKDRLGHPRSTTEIEKLNEESKKPIKEPDKNSRDFSND